MILPGATRGSQSWEASRTGTDGLEAAPPVRAHLLLQVGGPRSHSPSRSQLPVRASRCAGGCPLGSLPFPVLHIHLHVIPRNSGYPGLGNPAGAFQCTTPLPLRSLQAGGSGSEIRGVGWLRGKEGWGPRAGESRASARWRRRGAGPGGVGAGGAALGGPCGRIPARGGAGRLRPWLRLRPVPAHLAGR